MVLIMLRYLAPFLPLASGSRQLEAPRLCRSDLNLDPARSMGIILPCYYRPRTPRDENERTDATWRFSVVVTAYPSIGGIVIDQYSGVEVDYLGLSREIVEVRSPNLVEEDEFALRMLSLGSHWWQSWRLYKFHMERMDDICHYDFHFPPTVNVGYPSTGGVWVLRHSADTQSWTAGEWRKPYLPHIPHDLAKPIDKASIMDERCEVLKSFGATFYEYPGDCSYITKTLEDAYEKGKYYEELMERMGNWGYVDAWLENLSFEPPEYPTQ